MYHIHHTQLETGVLLNKSDSKVSLPAWCARCIMLILYYRSSKVHRNNFWLWWLDIRCISIFNLVTMCTMNSRKLLPKLQPRLPR